MSGSALIAIGGNSLIRAGEKGTVAEQLANARRVSEGVVALLKQGWRMVITHGNGPQVGAALLRSERAAGQVYEQGLDVCVATTQGEIGYILQQSLQLEIRRAGLPHEVAAILTQVVVDADDPAFRNPTKPVGPFLSRGAAEEKSRLFGWVMAEDAARGYRRVVPSPEPLEIVEEELIRRILGQGILTVAVGGGGIPVVRENGLLRGVDAVIDKDRASALLAQRLPVDLLVFSTGAEYVYLNYRKPGQRAVIRAGVTEMRGYHEAGHFPPGSMGPKIESAIRFLEGGGKKVIVTSDEHLVEAFQGSAGTHIVPDSEVGG
ncbi:MAG: carbamate kinase [Acidobacteria bacterium]|nr:carbamate kinase [Acidobacteriota bacterium]